MYFGISIDKLLPKYTPKRTKLHNLKKNIALEPHSFAASQLAQAQDAQHMLELSLLGNLSRTQKMVFTLNKV